MPLSVTKRCLLLKARLSICAISSRRRGTVRWNLMRAPRVSPRPTATTARVGSATIARARAIAAIPTTVTVNHRGGATITTMRRGGGATITMIGLVTITPIGAPLSARVTHPPHGRRSRPQGRKDRGTRLSRRRGILAKVISHSYRRTSKRLGCHALLTN
jgi:hypothetical protein